MLTFKGIIGRVGLRFNASTAVNGRVCLSVNTSSQLTIIVYRSSCVFSWLFNAQLFLEITRIHSSLIPRNEWWIYTRLTSI